MSSDFQAEVGDVVLGFQSNSEVQPTFEAVNWSGVGGLAGGAFQRIRDLLANIVIENMTKDEFVKLVLEKYDDFIAPAIMALGPWGIFINPIVRQLVKGLASRFYDNHSGPA